MRRPADGRTTTAVLLLIYLLLLALVVTSTASIGTKDQQLKPTSRDGRGDGNVGCLLSHKLCRKQEVCYDDFAFGRCLSRHHVKESDDVDVDQRDLYKFSLDKAALRQLEREFRRLFIAGYRWAHSYTQCIVKRLLDSFRRRRIKASSSSSSSSSCVGKEDDDLARALQFLEAEHKVDPRDLAIIKFQPSLVDPHPAFGDEMYAPSEPLTDEVPESVYDEDGVAYSRDVGVVQKYPTAYDAETRSDELMDDVESAARFDGRRKLKRKQPMSPTTDAENNYEDEDVSVPLSDTQLEELGSLIIAYAEENPREFLRDIEYPVRRQRDKGGISWSFSKHKQGGSATVHQTFDVDHLIDAALKKSVYAGDESDTMDVSNNGDDDDRDRRLLYLSGLLRLDPTVTFERPHRYDVKKPGPYFKVNNYVFEKTKEADMAGNSQSSPSEVTSFRRHHLVAGEPPPPSSHMDIDIGNESGRAESMKRADFHVNGEGSNPSSDYPLAVDYNEDRVMKVNLFPGDLMALDDYLHADDSSSIDQTIEDLDPIINPRIYSSSLFAERGRRIKANINRGRPEKLGFTKTVDFIGSPSAAAAIVIDVTKKGPTYDGKTGKETLLNRDGGEVEPRRMVPSADPNQFDVVDTSCVYLVVDNDFKDWPDSNHFVKTLETLMDLPPGTFTNVRQNYNRVLFKVNSKEINGSVVANKAKAFKDKLFRKTGMTLASAGIGDKSQLAVEALDNDNRMFIVTFIVCGIIAGAVIAVGALYVVRRHARSREKLQNIAQLDNEASHDYQDLCRQRMASKNTEKPEPIHVAQRVMSRESETSVRSPSSRSSTSSWNEEPVLSNMDISTGHMVLSYMEDHLNNKDRLDQEWIALCAYEADSASTAAAVDPANIKKNRYENILPYDNSRVVLNEVTNIAGSDYINASTITDHDPRNPAYVACQGPLPHTSADFWQMVWEQGSVVIVMLTRLVENGMAMCHRYWPEEGSELYHIYEVHLVSEHIWCEDYLVRSFYLKNLKTGETRTVTQFHFLSWTDNGVPNATKALLDYRRKVNKSYRGRSCPIVVHCSDGIGRTGTYCLIDMVLNRMAKGAKEIDIAATLEHIRDQRTGMVRTKAQFEFALMAVAEEVHAILKALPQ